jgi:hypothetical protein
MNEKDILGRLKKADPATDSPLGDDLIEGAIASGQVKAKAARKRNSLFAAVGSGALALSVVASLTLGQASPTGLITLGQQQGNPAEMSSREASSLSSDKMMMISPFIYSYVAGSGLSNETGNDRVYKLELTGESQALLAKLMRTLGVTGEITSQKIDLGADNPGYEMFMVGEQDGRSKTINLSWVGSGSWWFYDPSAYPESVCATFSKTEDGTEFCSIYEEQKPTPELVPTAAEARAEAVRIFKSVGFSVDSKDIRVNSDVWGAWASASMQLNGEDTPIEYSVSWSSIGKLASVSGHSAKFVDKGEFKTISAKDAVERISDWRYAGSISTSAYEKYFSQQAQIEPYPSTPTTKDGVEGDASLMPAVEPTPTPVTVVINESVKTHVLIWDSLGNTWLVPGYIFIADGNYISPVFSLEEGVVALPPKQ